MSININSTSNSVKEIKFTSASATEADVTKLLLNGTTVWAKPFQLFLAIGSGVSSVNVVRTSKTDPAAENTTTVTSSKTIPVYYGETIMVTPTALSGYTLSGTWPQTLNIVENTSIAIDATSNNIQLLPPIINSYSTGYLKEERRFSLIINVTNPNTVKVRVDGELFNINAGMSQVLINNVYEYVDAGSSSQILIEDYDDQIGLRSWAENFAFVALRCYDWHANDGIVCLSSPYKFCSTNSIYKADSVNNSNNKITNPAIGASYSTPAQGDPYSVKINVLSGWDFPVKLILTTPKGIVEIERDDWWVRNTGFDPYTISVDSLDSVIKAQLVDMTRFGLEPSDEVTFNLSDANNTDDDENTR